MYKQILQLILIWRTEMCQKYYLQLGRIKNLNEFTQSLLVIDDRI